MHVNRETADETHVRLLRVLRQAELTVLDGAFGFTEHVGGVIPPTAAERALALVRDGDLWSVLGPLSAPVDQPLRVFAFHFPPAADNSGFVGWLASHLKRVLGTGVLVVCGFNSRRGGVFDYWCVPAAIGEDAVAEVQRLRAAGC